jgi:hypothetical protein
MAAHLIDDAQTLLRKCPPQNKYVIQISLRADLIDAQMLVTQFGISRTLSVSMGFPFFFPSAE